MAYEESLKFEYDFYEEAVVREDENGKIIERYYYKREPDGGKRIVHTYSFNVLKDKKAEYAALTTDSERLTFLAKKSGLL